MASKHGGQIRSTMINSTLAELVWLFGQTAAVTCAQANGFVQFSNDRLHPSFTDHSGPAGPELEPPFIVLYTLA